MPKADMKYLGKVKLQDQDVDEMNTFQYQQIAENQESLWVGVMLRRSPSALKFA